MSVTDDRGAEVDFSKVYRLSSLRLLTPAGRPVEPAAARSVLVVAGSTAATQAPLVLPAARIQTAPDYRSALAALAAGRADGLLGDEAILRGVTSPAPDAYVFTGEPLRPERHAVAVAKGDEDLLGVVDSVIEDSAAPEVQRPDGRALRRIKRRGHLIAGVLSDVPDIGFRDPATGAWSGREVDICQAVAARVLGDPARVVFEPVTTRTKLPKLRSWNHILNPLLRWVSVFICVLNGNWWHLGMAGRLHPSLCPKGCEQQQDFVAFDYYWGVSSLRLHKLQQLAQAASGHYTGAPVWPAGLGRLIRRQSRLFGGSDVMVAENGCVVTAGGMSRADYLRRHLDQVRRAVRRDVPVIAYICWAITSNREWGLPFGPDSDFGLYRVRLDDDPLLARERQPAADVYKELIAGPWP